MTSARDKRTVERMGALDDDDDDPLHEAATLRARVEQAVGRDAVRPDGRGGHVALAWDGLALDAVARGSQLGRMAWVFSTELGSYEYICERVPLAKLLEHIASNASVRVVVRDGRVVLESVVVASETDEARLDDVVRWRLAELYTVATAWRATLGLGPARGEGAPHALTLAELEREVRPTPEHALLVAAVAFGAAGADGRISDAERDKLRGWLTDVPAFAGLELARVVDAIARMAADPGRTLMESARRLDARARLLAWGLANDMACADGFASDDERRYLTNVASVFKLSAQQMAPLAAEAQARAVRRETLVPPPPTR